MFYVEILVLRVLAIMSITRDVWSVCGALNITLNVAGTLTDFEFRVQIEILKIKSKLLIMYY